VRNSGCQVLTYASARAARDVAFPLLRVVPANHAAGRFVHDQRLGLAKALERSGERVQCV